MMTDTPEAPRPVPRWLHVWAVITASALLVLLVIGQFVTSFRAGMADPIWPTEPWYLINNYRLDAGYLIEHTHRIAGWTVGVVASLLALGLWYTSGQPVARWLGLVALAALLVGFGEFHRAMLGQREPGVEVVVPAQPVVTMLVALAVIASLGVAGLVARTPAAGVRALGLVGLVAVMIQGLFGGFRVKLNELVGTDLAAVHGVFGQLVLALFVALAVLTAPTPAQDLPPAVRRPLGRLSLALVGLLFVQLVWGALVRHRPDSLTQRLHILTAFLVVVTGVWALRIVFTTPAARPRLAGAAWALSVLLALQVLLGVEAWMGKFGEEARGGKPSHASLPEAEPVTRKQAAIRTSHALVGAGVLAAAVALAVGVRVRVSVASDDTGSVREPVVAEGLPALALVSEGLSGESL